MDREVHLPDGTVLHFPDGTPDDKVMEITRRRAASVNPQVPIGVAKSLLSGAAKGVAGIAGTPGDVSELVGQGVRALGDKVGLEAKPTPPPDSTVEQLLMGARRALEPPTSAKVRGAVESVTGSWHEPETRAERYADTTGQFMAGAALAPGNQMVNALRYGVAPGIASEFGGELAQKYAPGNPYAEAAGRVLPAMAAPFVTRKVITPHPALDPEHAQMVNALRGEGVTAMTPGQVSGKKSTRYMESVLADTMGSGTSAEDINTRVMDQFTRAALRRGGENSPRASHEVMRNMDARTSQEYNRLTGTYQMPLDQQVQNDMLGHVSDYYHNTNPASRSPVPENLMNDAAKWAGSQGGRLTGEQYNNLRSRLGKMSVATHNDPQLSETLAGLRDSLDTAMERSIAATRPDDLGAFRAVRDRYRNQLILEQAAAGTGEQAAHGHITPARLQAAVKNIIKQRDFVQGNHEMSQLAQAGAGVLSPLPQSGTGPREQVIHQLWLAAMLAGGGGVEHGAAGTALGALGGLVLPPAIARARFAGPVQPYLKNQAIPRVPFGQDTTQQMLMLRALQQGVEPRGAPAEH